MRDFGILSICQKRQHGIQILSTPLTVGGAAVGRIDPSSEGKRLACNFLLTRPQGFLPSGHLCGQSLRRFTIHYVEQLQRSRKAFLCYPRVTCVIRAH